MHHDRNVQSFTNKSETACRKKWQFRLGIIGLAALATLSFSIRYGAAQHAQSEGLSLAMAQVMSPEELTATGVSTLSVPQRHELDQWLTSYTRRVLKIGMNQACRDWDQDSLESVADDGKILTTDSGGIFEVDAFDRVDTALWEDTDDILLHCNGPTCTIINLDEQGEIAGATRLK